MKSYNIWAEGWCATGGGGGAVFFGESSGNTFREACITLLNKDKSFNKENLSWWGCKLFDNEQDARRSFG